MSVVVSLRARARAFFELRWRSWPRGNSEGGRGWSNAQARLPCACPAGSERCRVPVLACTRPVQLCGFRGWSAMMISSSWVCSCELGVCSALAWACVCAYVRVRACACVWTDRSCGVGAGLGFKSGAGGGFYKLSADHSECKQASNIGNNTKSWHVGTVSQAAPHRWFGSGCLSHSRAQALMCVYAGVQMCSARMPGTSGPRAAFSAESSTRRCVVFVYGVCVVYVSLAGVPV